ALQKRELAMGWGRCFRSFRLAAMAVVFLAACSAQPNRPNSASASPDRPDSAQVQAHQAALLRATLENAATAPASPRRLFFIGFALYYEPLTENDVVDFGRELSREAPSFAVVPLVFSNLVEKVRRLVPALTPEAGLTR